MDTDWGVAAVLREHTAPVNSMDFSADGELLVTAANDDRVCIYSSQSASLQRTVRCGQYGAAHVRFTHDPLSVLCASTRGKHDAIRYLSLHGNRYLRYFEGHAARVTSLQLSPKDDTFASAAADGTARFWDLRTAACQGVLRLGSKCARPAVAFDPQGLIFTAAGGDGKIYLYDARKYQGGPFDTFAAVFDSQRDISTLKFNRDGKVMLVATTRGEVLTLDAFKGGVIGRFSGHSNATNTPIEAELSADGAQVLSGSEDGTVWRWDEAAATPLAPLRAHTGAVTVLRHNPTRRLLASAGADGCVCLWLPAPNGAEQMQQATGGG